MARIHYWELSNYNSGRLIGRWFELDGLTHDEHRTEIKEWLAELTEKTGALCEEYIVGDSEDIPACFVGEYSISRDFFDYLELVENSHLGEDVFLAGIELGISPENIEDMYYGQFDSDREFAEELTENSGLMADVPDIVKTYFDYDSYARDLMTDGFSEQNGHYFQF